MKNFIIILSLILGFGILSSCEQNEIFFPECDEEDLGIILSGHTWEVESTGEIITFHEDGSLEDDDLFFSFESATTKTWSTSNKILSTKASAPNRYRFTNMTVSKLGCNRVVFGAFWYSVVLIKEQ